MLRRLLNLFLPLSLFSFVVLSGIYVFAQSNDETFAIKSVSEIQYYMPDFGRVAWSREYKKLSNDITTSYAETTQAKESGEIYQEYDLPQNQASVSYINSYINRLVSLNDNLKTLNSLNTDDETDPMKRIAEIQKDYDSLVKDFAAGADFDEIEMVNDQGEKIIDLGVNANKKQNVNEDVLSMEDKARDFHVNPDGKYADEADELADIFGMEIVYGLNNMSPSCQDTLSQDPQYIVAMVCSANANIIYANTHYAGGDVTNDRNFINYIKHEISHKLILDQCGTMSPDIAGDNYEAVTSSYAVKYLGADYAGLQLGSNDFYEYKMTDETDSIASSIHDNGLCVADAVG